MPSSPSLPSADAIARLLRDLFGKGVTSKKAAPMPPATKVFAGTYVDDSERLAGVCVCDLPLAAVMGAALALISPGAAADAARKGELPEEMVDNLREVLNVMASLFGVVHVRLSDLLPPSDPLPPPPAAIVTRPASRVDLELVVAGYAPGRLSLLVG